MTQTPNEPGRGPVAPQTNQRRRGRGRATPSRVGSLWVASILFAVVLLLLLIFVLQNGQSATISYLGAHGNLPQGVALLLAAVFGILLVALPGTARIIQLRIRDRRHRGAEQAQPPIEAGATGPAGPMGYGETVPEAGAPNAMNDAGAGWTSTPPNAAPSSPAGATSATTQSPSMDSPAAPVATQPVPPVQPPAQSRPPTDRR
jgi:uncharacterized integral membrane protein